MQQTIQDYIITKLANTAKLESITFFFMESNYAIARIALLDSNGNFIKSINVNLTKEQLDAWGEDDGIVLQIVLDAARLEKI